METLESMAYLYSQSGSLTLQKRRPAKAAEADPAVFYVNSTKGNKANMSADSTVMLLTMENQCQIYASCLDEVVVRCLRV